MKRNDIILLCGILLLAAVLFVCLGRRDGTEAGAVVVVSVKGEEYGRYVLTKNQKIEITGPLGSNYLRIEAGMVWMEEAVCPDHYCIRQGKTAKAGEQIICLPNGIVVEILGGEERGLDGIVS
jgi:hypothetical protein